ncbi:MAG: VPLPA-CTERM sorting domain-containing protein [Pseudomonadota bacterium]
MKRLQYALTLAIALGATSAQAATVSITEGKRDTILGSTKIGDAKGAPNRAHDAGALAGGETLNLYGRMVGAVDTFSISSATDMVVSFIFGGYQTATSVSRSSGFVSLGAADNTSVFRLLNAANPSEVVAERTFTSGILSEASNGDTAVIFNVAAGNYLFQIDGSGQGNGGNAALYDVQFSAAEVSPVPLPASALLLLAGVGAMGAMRRLRARTV